MKRICVFCGSSAGASPLYAEAAKELGEVIAESGIGLVYGGAQCGLMGAVANAALAHGGEVIGVIPEAMIEKEIAHVGISDLRIVRSMHERKMLMSDLADAFIAMPGGMGTIEEFCEILTWAQLGIHAKPCGLLDTEDGFFTHMRRFFDHAVDDGFIRPEHRALVMEDSDPESLLDRMAAFRPAHTVKWTEIPAAVPEA